MIGILLGLFDYCEDVIGICKKKVLKVSWIYLGLELFGSIWVFVNFINYIECVEKII